MKKFLTEIRLTKEGKQAAAGISAAAVVVALLVFFLLFKVDKVEIVGSTKYSDKEIKEYALSSPLTSNTLLAVMFKDHIEAENIPFVESFDLEQVDMHTLRVHVNEKKIIGYVVQGTTRMYFDKDGKVVEKEAMEEEEIAKMEAQTEELNTLKQKAEQEAALEAAKKAEEELTGETGEEESGENEIVQPEEIQTLQAEEVNVGNEDATEFRAAVTDVPRIVGLETGKVQMGKKISVKDSSVFNTILGITRMVEKYKILPEIVSFDEKMNITLVYFDGAVHCELGQDTLLEEKITRVAAILQKLEHETGILHLEDYTTETTNIIFSRESLYTLKKKIAEAQGIVTEQADGQDGSTEGTPTSGAEETPTPEGEGSLSEGTPTPEGEESLSEGTPTPEGEGSLSERTPTPEGEESLSEETPTSEGENSPENGADSSSDEPKV